MGTGEDPSEVLLRVWGPTAAHAERAEQLARESEAATEWSVVDVVVSVAPRCTIRRRDPDALASGAANYKAWAFYPAAARLEGGRQSAGGDGA